MTVSRKFAQDNEDDAVFDVFDSTDDVEERDFDSLLGDWALGEEERLLVRRLDKPQMTLLMHLIQEEHKEGREIHEYLREIISCFTTGDEELDMQNIELVVETLHDITKQDKEQLMEMVKSLREMY